MKKIITLTLTFILVFSLVSCKVAEKEEPTPEPTILYICDIHEIYNEELIKIGKIEKGKNFRKYIYDPLYADYSFCFTLSLRTPSYKVSDVAAYTEQEADRLMQLDYNVWITGEDKTVIQGIATQKELQDFPYDLESFGYRIYLSTNEPNGYHPDFAFEED